jgi:cytochrome c-type biogenesis protein CcmH/NrfG
MAYKFCPECGAAAQPGGRFCVGCGQPLAGATPSPSSRAASPTPIAGLVALAVLLVVGGGFWFYYRLAPTPDRPLKPGEGRVASGAGGAPAGEATGGPAAAQHPQIALPDDIKQYIAGLAKDAQEKPKDVAAWQTLARVYYRASRLDPSYGPKAEEAYAHLVGIDPKNLEGLRGLGNIAYDKQDRARAIELYGQVLQIKPDDAEVRTDMGTMLFESGQPDRAIAEYQKVIAEQPTFFQAYFNLGIVFDAQGDRVKSREQLEKARDLAPDDAVKQRIAALLEASADGKSLAQAAQDLATAANAAAQAQGGAGGVAAAGAGMPGGAIAGGGAPGAPHPPGGPGAGAPAGAAAARPAADATTFPASVEALFRNHPIAGPKIVAIEWPSPDRGRVVMQDFPMDAMPESMRDSYLDKMRKGVGDAKTRFAMTGKVTVELVDRASGRVMASVDS